MSKNTTEPSGFRLAWAAYIKAYAALDAGCAGELDTVDGKSQDERTNERLDAYDAASWQLAWARANSTSEVRQKVEALTHMLRADFATPEAPVVDSMLAAIQCDLRRLDAGGAQ